MDYDLFGIDEENNENVTILFKKTNEQHNCSDMRDMTDMTDMIDDRCEQINHQRFQKYIGHNRYLVFILLALLNPRKQIMMFSKKYISCFILPFQKNTINIVYDNDNNVVKIRYNSIKKIE